MAPEPRRGSRFTKGDRVRRRGEYLAIQQNGRKLGGLHFLLLCAAGRGRLGITVTKKVGNAVTRNRVKRYVREFARLSAGGPWLRGERDVVVIARPSAATASYREIVADLERLGGRL